MPPPAGHAVPGLVAVRCTRRARCTGGRLWLEGASFATAVLVNGAPPDDVLDPVSVRFALRRGERAAMRFRVPRPALDRARDLRVLRLRLAVTSADQPFALLGRFKATLRPRQR